MTETSPIAIVEWEGCFLHSAWGHLSWGGQVVGDIRFHHCESSFGGIVDWLRVCGGGVQCAGLATWDYKTDFMTRWGSW